MSDWKEWMEDLKKSRKEKQKLFVDKYFHIIEEVIEIEERPNGSFTMEILNYGVVDFYPKKDRLLIRQDNKWISQGLKFILNQVILLKQ